MTKFDTSEKCSDCIFQKVAHCYIKIDALVIPLVPVVKFVCSIGIVDARLGRRGVGGWQDGVACLVTVSCTISVTIVR